MIPFGKRSAAVIFFTVLIIVFVNLAWWLFYGKTKASFEYQLSHRLASISNLGASCFPPELIASLADGYLSAYDSTLEILDRIRDSDSLSEVFILNSDYQYLATTSQEPDTTYFLSALNGNYIDSVFSRNWGDSGTANDLRNIVTTSGYQVGDIVLKSAFAPLIDTSGAVVAVLGIEADVDYTDVLLDFRRNLYLSTAISVGAGLMFGLFFFFVQKRINAAERSMFLSQSQANLGRMVAVVSHEIRNPLMIIRGSAERLQKSGMKEADFIIEETDRLNMIVSGYLDFASGRRVLKPEIFNPIDLMTEIIAQFAPRLTRDGITLQNKYAPDECWLEADKLALRQVVINLILNAADAVRGRSGASVLLGCVSQGNRITMEVTDNGAGIEESEMKSIFEPFYTTKTTGSGLGLFYSQRLIKEMGGNITVESQKGGPTIFRVFLARSEKG